MAKYKIEIIVWTRVVATYEFDNIQEARECYYKNDSILDQYTKLYVDNQEIRPIPQITKILGSAPKHLWCADKYKYD